MSADAPTEDVMVSFVAVSEETKDGLEISVSEEVDFDDTREGTSDSSFIAEGLTEEAVTDEGM